MKKFFMIAVMAVAAISASAQEVGEFFVTPKAGINLASLTKAEDSKMKIGFVVGAEGGYQMTEEFSLTAGLLYSQQGVKGSSYVENYQNGMTAKGTLDSKINLAYLNVPILANYMLAPGLTVKLGIQPGFLLSAKMKNEGALTVAGYGDVDVDQEDDIKDNCNSFDLSMPIGISYEFSNVVLDARYNLGLTKCFKEGEDSKNSVFQITLGYKF